MINFMTKKVIKSLGIRRIKSKSLRINKRRKSPLSLALMANLARKRREKELVLKFVKS